MTEITRRTFINLAVLSSAAAVVTGCGESHEQLTGQYGGADSKGIPYVDQPEGLNDGVPQYFATTCEMCPAGCGLFVRTMGGRAIKIEGNPDHPVNRGKTCARGQAALQQLYNPGRLRSPIERDNTSQSFAPTSWDAAIQRMRTELANSHGNTAIVVDADTYGRSPFALEMLQDFASTVGAELIKYSLLDDAPWRAACRDVYGRDQLPDYRLDEADVIVAFSANFLEAWPSPVRAATLFGEFRQGARRKAGDHGYFVYIGPRMSMTAAKADLWLPCAPGQEGIVAEALLNALSGSSARAGQLDITAGQIAELAKKMQTAGVRTVAVAGDGLLGNRTATQDFLAVEKLNAQMRSRCVSFGTTLIKSSDYAGSIGRISTLIAELNSGRITNVVFVGQANPVFTLPSVHGLQDALKRAKFVAALTPFEDETTATAHVVLPTRAFLEDWGDHSPLVSPTGWQGASLRQSIIDPQYILASGTNGKQMPWMDTWPLLDILAGVASASNSAPTAETQLRARWSASVPTTVGVDQPLDAGWLSLLSQGGNWKVGGGAAPFMAPPGAPVRLNEDPFRTTQASVPTNHFALLVYPHIYWYDGRHANCTWLQEIPDPMSATVWNSWVEINLQVAEKMGIRTGDIVRITSDHGAIEVPALPFPAIHPQAIAMPIGQGHTAASFGEAANKGANPLAILDPTQSDVGTFAFNATRVRLEKVRSAASGYDRSLDTLVLVQDRPNGQEPEALQNLIHETAGEAKRDKLNGVPAKTTPDVPSLGKRS